VWLWKVANPARPRPDGTLTGDTDWVNTVAFSPDGRSLAAGSSDDQVLVWNLATGSVTATLTQPQPVTSVVWDGVGHLVAGDADGMVRNWILPTPVLDADGPVNSVAYGPDGRLLAVGGNSLQVWNPASRSQLRAAAVTGPVDTDVNAVAFSPAGTSLAAGYSDGMIQLWRVAPGGALAPLSRPLTAQKSRTDLVEFAAFSPDGRLLATCGDDGTVRLWSVTDPADPRPLATVHDSPGTIAFSVAFSPDGRTLAVASADGLTRLWDVSNPAGPVQFGRPLAGPASYAISVAFSPDGRTLAVGSADKRVRLWDVADLSRPVPLGQPLTGPTGYVYSVAFSPDGRTLAAGVTDGTVWLWRVTDPARPTLVASLTGPAHAVYSVAFAPGGASLAAGSADGTIRLWDTQARAASAEVCASAGQQLTSTEWRIFLPGRRYAPPCAG
jgi:WD40 repeat protein